MQKGVNRWTRIAMLGGLTVAVVGGFLWILAAANGLGYQGYAIMLIGGLMVAAVAFAVRVLRALERS